MTAAWDCCVGCGVHVLTLDNSNRVIDQKALAPKWMPKGGCTCGESVEDVDPGCKACYPTEHRCHNCPPNLHENVSFEPDGQLKLQLEGAGP